MEQNKKERIWELDAFRGLFILGMVVVHILYDIKYMFGADIELTGLYEFVREYGSALFILLSGICVTLGRHNFKRGATVLALGVGIGIVMELLGYIAPNAGFGHIYFGILHLLGVCMLLYPLFAKLPWWLTAVIGVVIISLAGAVKSIPVEGEWLLPLGISHVSMADYFPIFPNLGTFLIGIALGKTLYKEKKSLLPSVIGNTAPVRFLSLCGRASLWIYIAHQPVVYGVLWLVFCIIK